MKQHCLFYFVDLKIFGVCILNYFKKKGAGLFVHFFACLQEDSETQSLCEGIISEVNERANI